MNVKLQQEGRWTRLNETWGKKKSRREKQSESKYRTAIAEECLLIAEIQNIVFSSMELLFFFLFSSLRGKVGLGALGDLLQSELPALEAAEDALVGVDELVRALGVMGAARAEDCDGDRAIPIEEFRLMPDPLSSISEVGAAARQGRR
jgi:hypothetical protein